ASSKQPHPSTSTRLPALTPHPTLGEKPTFRPNPSTKQEAIERHLVSSRTSNPKRHPQQSASIIQASPSKQINSTSRSHSPPDVGPSIPTKATSVKQEAIASHLASSRTSKPKQRPQQSASIIQASPSKHINSTSRSRSPPDVWGKTDIPTKPFHQARSNRKTSRILENEQAQTTPTTKCKHHPSKPVQAHQLDIPLSLPPEVGAQHSD
ncbi:hypothetical protein CSA_017399, partial [Cucumis sativus]